MLKRNKGDMPRAKVNIMRHFTPPEAPPESKRKKLAKIPTHLEALEAFFLDVHEQITIWREFSTGQGKHRRCHLPACKRHRQCCSRNDPYLIDRFCHLKERKRQVKKYTGVRGSVRQVYGL
jgi:hypothetical protein